MTTRKPNLFIVGQSKAGTSALYYYLQSHPDVFMSSVKEPSHFCTDFIRESDEFYGFEKFFPYRDREKYLRLFSEATHESVLGESSTMYIFSKNASKEIHYFNSKAKIIIMLREPVSFLVSLHNENYRKAHEDIGDFQVALSMDDERRSGRKIPSNCYCPSLLVYRDRITYREQVSRYLDAFGKEQVKVVIYDDFRDDNERVSRDILDFIGVTTDFTALVPKKNVSGLPRFDAINTFVMSSPVKLWLQRHLPHGLYEKFKPIGRAILWKKERPEGLSSEFRHELMVRFKPEVQSISDLLGQDLVTRWGYDKL